MSTDPIVIIGGGHATAQLCASLVDAGCHRTIHVITEEPQLPYHRPPLSKAYLKSDTEPLQVLRDADWYAKHGIQVHLGDPVQSLQREQRSVTLRSGTVIPYGHAVLATGARARWLPNLAGGLAAGWQNVATVRTAADAEQLRPLLHGAESVTVLGGGFIGLEVAATARALGKTVTVLESAPRLLGRALSPEMAAHVLQVHRDNGITVEVGVAVGHFDVDGQRVRSVTVAGVPRPVDLLVMGIGAVPETALAHAAGLTCDNGIEVDACMRTADPCILAVGDCTSFPTHALAPHISGRLRLESVQNANDQARTAAATLMGREEPYRALPWFWSEQGSMRLQMAGLMPADGPTVQRLHRPGAQPHAFSVLHVVDGVLMCAESVNAPLDHMASRKLIEQQRPIDVAKACDPAVQLKTLI